MNARAPHSRAFEIAVEHLSDAANGWSIGVLGALAEFERDGGEYALLDGPRILTSRGGIALRVPEETRAIAYELPSAHPDAWLHGVALCVPENTGFSGPRTGLAELGPDSAALRAEDRESILFDLGFGSDCCRFCVRSAEPDQIAALRACAGGDILRERALFDRIVDMSPHRVFISAVGRIEVFQRIGRPHGVTPAGPHTHVLPKLMRAGRAHSANMPVPGGWIVAATIHPPHPVRDRLGQPKPFNATEHASFQGTLRDAGDSALLQVKREVWRAVRSGRAPADLGIPSGRHARLARKVALRQLAYTDGSSPALRAWQAAFDQPAASTTHASSPVASAH